ncbi:hypothetical protein Tco_1059335 [Tanacetum coccineum]
MVAFLEKPVECEGFEQIVDFLNVNPIKYALTANPTIYTSCIEQFWATAKVKTVNEEVQLQALVDRKNVIITEASIRRDLQLEDAEGIECLPNAAIFEQLALMGYEKLSQKLTFYKTFFSPQWKFLIHTILQCLSAKTTAWNEFSSTMASAIICLATNQKFNFSKYIFESMVKNLNNENKFLMYPRFVQVFLDKQVGDMSTHDEIYVTPSHTKKVFGNMKRVGKGFSGAVTPLFPTMMVKAQEEMGEGSANPIDPHHTPIITQPSTSQPQKKQSRRKQRKSTEIPQSSGPTEHIADEAPNEENVPTHSNDPLLSGEDRLKLKELMDLCTNLQNRVLALETTKTNQALEIDSLKRMVKRLEKKDSKRTHKLKRLYKGRINAIDADEDIYLVNVPRDEDMFGVNDLEGDEVVVESDVFAKKKDDEVNVVEEVVSTAGDVAPVSAATITTVELTLAQTLAELKSARPKAKELVIPEQEPSESITTTTTKTTTGILLQEPSETRTTTTPAIPSKDKGKGIMVEDPLKMKKKDQVSFDQQEAIRLQAQFDEEERIAKDNEEANADLIA